MRDTFKTISKIVYSTLSGITHNIYPLIAENSTTFPFIVYSREGFSTEFCKDGNYEDTALVSIKVVASTYESSIKLAQDVRERLTLHNVHFDGLVINSEIDNAVESYSDNSYIQDLTFQIKINN